MLSPCDPSHPHRTEALSLFLGVFLTLLLLCASKSAFAYDIVDNRIFAARTASNNTIAAFSCSDTNAPVVDPASNVSHVCTVECLNTACSIYQFRRFTSESLQGAEHLDFGVSGSNSPALLYANTQSVNLVASSTLALTDKWTRRLRVAENGAEVHILGTCLGRTLNESWHAAFVEQLGTTSFRTVLITCTNATCENWNETVVSRWQSTTFPKSSPCFVKSDLYGRTIIGFQAFSFYNFWFEIWRCEISGFCSLMSNTTIPISSFSLRIAPLTRPSNFATVLLGGPYPYMFHYISGRELTVSADPVPISPQPTPTPPVFVAPVGSPPFSEPISNTPELDPSPAPPESIPIEEPINDAPSPEITPTSALHPEPSLPADKPTPVYDPLLDPDSHAYWYTSSLNIVAAPAQAGTGFQVGFDLWDNFPHLALSVVRIGQQYRVFRGSCTTINCKIVPSLALLNVEPLAKETVGIPQVAVLATTSESSGPALVYFSHAPGGLIHRTVFFPGNPDPTMDAYFDFLSSSNSPNPNSAKFDTFGIIGVANAIVAAAVVLIAAMVFTIHFGLRRRDAAHRNARVGQNGLTSKQSRTLATFYAALKSD